MFHRNCRSDSIVTEEQSQIDFINSIDPKRLSGAMRFRLFEIRELALACGMRCAENPGIYRTSSAALFRRDAPSFTALQIG